MPTTLGPPFPWNYPGLPTHMSTEDHTIWNRYRARLAAEQPTLYFDVRLGDGRRSLVDGTPDELAFWYSINAKRADVVALYAEHVDLIEFRSHAQANAIGRLLTYAVLWKDDPPFPQPLQLELVTDAYDPDVERMAHLHSITYTLLPPHG